MEESKNRSSVYNKNNRHHLAGRTNNFISSGNKIAVSDNDNKLARASITSYGSGNIRTNTSSGSRWKRDINFKGQVDNVTRKIALSHLEKSESSDPTSLGTLVNLNSNFLGISSNIQAKRNIISDMNERRMSNDKGNSDKEYVRGFMK